MAMAVQPEFRAARMLSGERAQRGLLRCRGDRKRWLSMFGDFHNRVIAIDMTEQPQNPQHVDIIN